MTKEFQMTNDEKATSATKTNLSFVLRHFCFGRRRDESAGADAGIHRGCFWFRQRLRRLHGYGPDAANAQEKAKMSSTIPYIIIGVSVLFIIGIKLLASPKTARIGNLVAAAGMLIALLILHKTNGE